MLVLLQTVGRPVLTSGSTAVSTVLTASGLEAASASVAASDCRTLDVLIDVVWLHAVHPQSTHNELFCHFVADVVKGT